MLPFNYEVTLTWSYCLVTSNEQSAGSVHVLPLLSPPSRSFCPSMAITHPSQPADWKWPLLEGFQPYHLVVLVCCGLNVCIPFPKFTCWNPVLDVIAFRGGAFRRWLGDYRRGSRELIFLFCNEKTRWEVSKPSTCIKTSAEPNCTHTWPCTSSLQNPEK